MLSSLINLVFIITITQNAEPQVKYLKNMTVSYGEFKDKITIEWDKIECKSYTVLRSQFKTGPFEQVAQTSDTFFNDTIAVKGVKYWYKVTPVFDPVSETGNGTEAAVNDTNEKLMTDEDYLKATELTLQKISEQKKDTPATDNKNSENHNNKTDNLPETEKTYNYSGFIMPEKPVPLKLDNLIKQKKEKLKQPSDKKGNEQQQKQLEYLKQFYMHPVKFSLAITMAKPYLAKDELVILSDCGYYEINYSKREFVFFEPSYRYVISFESKKLLKVIAGSNDVVLNDLLLKNSELFCIYREISEITDRYGITRIVYKYDAVGLSTRYLKNDAEWKSRTIMVSSSRPDLKDMLRKASKTEE